VFCLLVFLAAGSRLLREVCDGVPPNFHAVIATSLFAGLYFRTRAAAIAVPLTAMLLSDWVIEGYDPRVMAAVYGGLVLPVAWRGFLRQELTPTRVGACAVVSSSIFFAVSNFAVWLWVLSEHTPATLLRCYAVAIPFFKYEVCGDLLFTAALFGAYALVQGVKLQPSLAAPVQA
jgi:hypothetical protein